MALDIDNLGPAAKAKHLSQMQKTTGWKLFVEALKQNIAERQHRLATKPLVDDKDKAEANFMQGEVGAFWYASELPGVMEAEFKLEHERDTDYGEEREDAA